MLFITLQFTDVLSLGATWEEMCNKDARFIKPKQIGGATGNGISARISDQAKENFRAKVSEFANRIETRNSTPKEVTTENGKGTEITNVRAAMAKKAADTKTKKAADTKTKKADGTSKTGDLGPTKSGGASGPKGPDGFTDTEAAYRKESEAINKSVSRVTRLATNRTLNTSTFKKTAEAGKTNIMKKAMEQKHLVIRLHQKLKLKHPLVNINVETN